MHKRRPLRVAVNDYLAFIKELPKSYSEIGAMLPSSKHLTYSMCEPISKRNKNQGPSRVLEVGPGTGPFTRRIISLMRPEDTLVICEINHKFIQTLIKSLETNKDFIKNKNNIFFFEGSVLDLPADLKLDGFDYIVSSLPFQSFSPDLVKSFLNFYDSVLKPEAIITFFHYAGLSKMSSFSPNFKTGKRIREVNRLLKSWCGTKKRIAKKLSVMNVPPAYSLCLQNTVRTKD